MKQNKTFEYSKEERINDLLYWIWNFQLQTKRLIESTNREWSIAEKDAIEKKKIYAATSFDEHILTVVLGNISRAIKSYNEIAKEGKIELTNRMATVYLRNIYEHWDESRIKNDSQSLDKLMVIHPSSKPFSITYTNDDWLLAGEFSLTSISKELEDIEKECLLTLNYEPEKN